jgi:hypothetical protein
MNNSKVCSKCKKSTQIEGFPIKNGKALKSCQKCYDKKAIYQTKIKCIHDKNRYTCMVCNIKSKCEHGSQPSQCTKCPGASGVCKHRKRRDRCNKCNHPVAKALRKNLTGEKTNYIDAVGVIF